MSLTIAHISDLHIGESPDRLRDAGALYKRIKELGVDYVFVTGDVTNNGLVHQSDQFQELFADFVSSNRLMVVPGNHDRLGDGVARLMMGNKRVKIIKKDGMHVVAVDTTAPHNRFYLLAHGRLDRPLMRSIEKAVAAADPGEAVIVALHHHVLQQEEDLWLEKVSSFFRLPMALELAMGHQLVQKLLGRCDLILHGHRHKPLATHIEAAKRALGVYNAGASAQLKKFRLFRFVNGKPFGTPQWIGY